MAELSHRLNFSDDDGPYPTVTIGARSDGARIELEDAESIVTIDMDLEQWEALTRLVALVDAEVMR